MVAANECPVCRARFRNTRICSRCGADLEPLMLLAAQAWWLRGAARRSLEAGDFAGAEDLAHRAEALQSTEAGEALRLVSSWLRRGYSSAP